MRKKLSLFLSVFILALCLNFPAPGYAGSRTRAEIEALSLQPTNTVILANQADTRFSQDFSPLLKHLSLEWVVLDHPVIPDSVRDKNLVLLGHLDSEYSGEVIRDLLTVDEIAMIQSLKNDHLVLEKESPWMENRTIYIGLGSDLLRIRDAAEEAIRTIVATAPPASDWFQTTYDTEFTENISGSVSQLQYQWDDAELPLADLTMDVNAKPPRKITPQQAAEDVERLFYLLSHGYSGYAFFNQQGELERAKTRSLQALASQPSWSGEALSGLLYEHLNFIADCHLTIGDYRFAEHRDFWYDTQFEWVPGAHGYQFTSNGISYRAVSINGADPASFLYPSLNQAGEPVYRLGLLSSENPPPIHLLAANDGGEQRFEVELQRSNFKYYAEDVFRQDILGGIPVVRVRGFGDSNPDELSKFVGTASDLRGEPVVIVDIRGNGGGNEVWPIRWIQGLTGQRAEAIFAFSELESKTSMVGRANAFNYWYRLSDVSSYEDEIAQFASITQAFENGTRQPGWTGPIYPQIPLIPNDTTVVLVTNNLVASAGEGMVMRISQAENVVVVGENTMGCLTFGNLSAHQLPHSKLMIWMPINFGLFMDLEFREEVGLTPDLWVPAADAVNYAVAAVRHGTITTAQPLPSTTLQQRFTPENPWARDRRKNIESICLVSVLSAGCLVWAFFMRKKPRIVTGMGGVWIIFGSILVAMDKQYVGLGFLLVGMICLIWGGITLVNARRKRSKLTG